MVSKYRSVKTTVNGITFDSRAEASRYGELFALERAHIIKDLTLQPKFLIHQGFRKCPKCLEYPSKGKTCPTCGTPLMVFRPRYYIADFSYTKAGELIIEDVKGRIITDVFKLKHMLFEQQYPELTLTIVYKSVKPAIKKRPNKR